MWINECRRRSSFSSSISARYLYREGVAISIGRRQRSCFACEPNIERPGSALAAAIVTWLQSTEAVLSWVICMSLTRERTLEQARPVQN